MRLRSLLLLVAVLLVAGCKRETKLDGDVFIVTKGGQNFKLGLVQVRFVSEKTATAAVPAAIETAKGRVSDLKKKLRGSQLDERAAAAEVSMYRTLESSWGDTVRKAAMLDPSREAKKAQEMARAGHLETLTSWKAALEKKAAATRATLAISGELRGALNGSTVIDGLGEAVATVKTDADGKFSVILPAGKYAAVATAQREVGGETESYTWAVWITAAEPQQRLMLSNDNLTSTHCTECLIPVEQIASASGPDPLPTRE